MRSLSKHLFATLVGTTILASCSRPVAYFQPSAREHFTAVSTQPVVTPEATVSEVIPTTLPVQVTQATEALAQMDAMVSNDTKLVTDKTVQKRLNRVRTLLASASAKATVAPTDASTPQKMNVVERLMLKKMNKKISKQLAPANPDRAMTNSGTLAAGAVLVIVGLLLLILTSGTAATVGLVAVLVGAVILLIGLL